MDEVAIHVAEASFPDDLSAIAALDTTFCATEKLAVERVEDGFQLSVRRLDTPVQKRFAIEDADRHWDVALVARVGSRPVGFAAATFHSWNARLAVSHFYVHQGYRRQGVGTALMGAIVERGILLAADHLWIETSNLNVPAIAAYRRWSFDLCGLDFSLYAATPTRGEVAIFLSRPLNMATD